MDRSHNWPPIHNNAEAERKEGNVIRRFRCERDCVPRCWKFASRLLFGRYCTSDSGESDWSAVIAVGMGLDCCYSSLSRRDKLPPINRVWGGKHVLAAVGTCGEVIIRGSGGKMWKLFFTIKSTTDWLFTLNYKLVTIALISEIGWSESSSIECKSISWSAIRVHCACSAKSISRCCCCSWSEGCEKCV